MARFDRAIATAERLIERNGEVVVWNTILSAAPDPATPWKQTDAADTSHDVTICFLPTDRVSRELFRYMRGTNDVPTGNLQGLMKGNISFVPKIKDTVTRDGETLVIRSVDLLSPNGQKVLYTIEFET